MTRDRAIRAWMVSLAVAVAVLQGAVLWILSGWFWLDFRLDLSTHSQSRSGWPVSWLVCSGERAESVGLIRWSCTIDPQSGAESLAFWVLVSCAMLAAAALVAAVVRRAAATHNRPVR